MITTIENTSNKEEWIQQLSDTITDPMQLLKFLHLDKNISLQNGIKARKLFSFRVPRSFATRMSQGDPNDPLLKQVITMHQEFNINSNFSIDPINEHHKVLFGRLLHKYDNRVLLLVKSSCAIHCRYCFRRHFPFYKNFRDRTNWKKIKNYIQNNNNIHEVILSGGDPLMAKDHEIDKIVKLFEEIPHINTLRIHSRLPVVIPSRITMNLCNKLSNCRLKIVLVTHINHAKEIDSSVKNGIEKLLNSKVILLNQSVLLNGINDDADILADLSNKLFDSGILPYYLHILDKVQGTKHFSVKKTKIKEIMKKLVEKLPGYLVPKLAHETGNKSSKILIESLF